MATSEDVETYNFLIEQIKKNNLRKKELQKTIDDLQGSSEEKD